MISAFISRWVLPEKKWTQADRARSIIESIKSCNQSLMAELKDLNIESWTSDDMSLSHEQQMTLRYLVNDAESFARNLRLARRQLGVK